MQTSSNDLKRLENILQNIQANVSQANQILRGLAKVEIDSDPHRDVPGIEGTFDGVFMNTKDGQKIEVPVNYAAKSRLVYGDTLKMIKVKEEGQDEKTLFKQLVKVPRKRIEGVLSRKDGKWYLLTESNSYRILDRAAEFNGASPNDVAFGLIPEGNMVVPFASLDSIKRMDTQVPTVVIHKLDAPKPTIAPPIRRRPAVSQAPAKRKGVVSAPNLQAAKKEFISELKPAVEKKPVEAPASVEEDDLR